MHRQTDRRSAASLAIGAAAITLLMTATSLRAESKPGEFVDHPALGGEIEQLCAEQKTDSKLLCTTYLHGTLDGLLFGQLDATGGLSSFCPPSAGIDLAKARLIFLKLMEVEPQRRSEEASMVLLDVLELFFPCPDDANEPKPEPSSPHANANANNIPAAWAQATGGGRGY